VEERWRIRRRVDDAGVDGASVEAEEHEVPVGEGATLHLSEVPVGGRFRPCTTSGRSAWVANIMRSSGGPVVVFRMPLSSASDLEGPSGWTLVCQCL
jgi:hypothetical protein